MSFSLKRNKLDDAFQVVSSMKVFTLAESLGGVESLSGHPASMTHMQPFQRRKRKTGVEGFLIRLSVGIEDIERFESRFSTF